MSRTTTEALAQVEGGCASVRRVRDLGAHLVYEGLRLVHSDGEDAHGHALAGSNYRIMAGVDRPTFERSVLLTK